MALGASQCCFHWSRSELIRFHHQKVFKASPKRGTVPFWLFVPISVVSYIFPGTPHQLLGDGAGLTVHLEDPLLILFHSDVEDPEVSASQVQCQEVALFWKQHNLSANINPSPLPLSQSFLILQLN